MRTCDKNYLRATGGNLRNISQAYTRFGQNSTKLHPNGCNLGVFGERRVQNAVQT